MSEATLECGLAQSIWGPNRFGNLSVFCLPETKAPSVLAARAIKTQVNIQNGPVLDSGDDGIVFVTPKTWNQVGNSMFF